MQSFSKTVMAAGLAAASLVTVEASIAAPHVAADSTTQPHAGTATAPASDATTSSEHADLRKQKITYQDGFEERLKSLNSQLKDVKKQLGSSGAEKNSKVAQSLTTAEAKKKSAEKTLTDFKHAKVEGWENRKRGLETAFSDYEKSLDEAKQMVMSH